jgi:hypothetical protein
MNTYRTYSQGSNDWKGNKDGATITAYVPTSLSGTLASEIIEPGSAVKISDSDRARMNEARPGVYTRPKPL